MQAILPQNVKPFGWAPFCSIKQTGKMVFEREGCPNLVYPFGQHKPLVVLDLANKLGRSREVCIYWVIAFGSGRVMRIFKHAGISIDVQVQGHLHMSL